ncbi:MAG: hypothetical protein QM831_15045 [Kofleriaceae bacterium]
MSTEISPLSIEAAHLQEERRAGESNIARGAVLLITIPLVVIAASFVAIGFHTFVPWLVAGIYLVVGGASGVVMFGMGLLQTRSAAKKLDALEASRIPTARLLE